MEKQFVETIKIKKGKVMSLSYHQERMNKTMQHFFPGQGYTMPRGKDSSN